MKKLLLMGVFILFLSACADKQQYEQAVLTEMQAEQDVKDYEIDPEKMAECVVDLSSKAMPGVFDLDPDRLLAYQHYTKMLSMGTTKDKQKLLEELRSSFGSRSALAAAHKNFAQSVLDCYSAIIQKKGI